MFMGLGATLLEKLVGRWLVPFVVPALCLATLTFGKMAWDRRDARLIKEGERMCDARWETEIRRQERAALEADVRAGRLVLEVERKIDEGLTNDLQALQSSIDLLGTLPDGGSSNCLSPGVLDLLEGGKNGAAPAAAKQSGKPAS